ncbi:MAG: hypothetical protein ACW98U_04465 [Candidatus Thorarchaeota archaeon]|jgi:hypothetical protein
MKLNKKHAFIILALGFLLSAPAVSALNTGSAVVAQEIGEDFFFQLIEDGAEVVAAMIGPEGEPAVVYGQLGVPSTRLALSDPMYTGCIVTALIATQGELLDYVLDLVGSNLLNFTGASFLNEDFMITQFPFGGEGPMDINSIFSMLGTDFSLLIDVFVNVDDATAQTNMAAIRTHLSGEFGFSFAELLNLRIDEEFIEGIIGEPVDLPFTGINVFIYQVTNEFEDAVNSVLDVMDQTGFLASIDRTVFSTARASGAGLLAIPDMGDLIDLIGGFTNTTPSPASFVISQLPDLDGPLAIAAAGYLGDQVLSTTSDELNIFEDLLGKNPLTPVNGLASGQSLVAAFTPGVNITGYSPMGVNASYHDVNASVTFWNATHFTDQTDYTLTFEEGSFPPLVTLTRSFDPTGVDSDILASGGTAEVTVSVHNQGTEPIYNLTVEDLLIGTTYESVDVTGTQSANSAVLAGGAVLNITYSVTFQYEGGYAFAPALLSYEYNGTTYYKQTHIDGYTVSADPVGLLQQMFNDGMPYTLGIAGVVSLGAIVNIALMARGRGGGTYQV